VEAIRFLVCRCGVPIQSVTDVFYDTDDDSKWFKRLRSLRRRGEEARRVAAQRGHIAAFLPSRLRFTRRSNINIAMDTCESQFYEIFQRRGTWHGRESSSFLAAARNEKMLKSALPDLLAVSHPAKSHSIVTGEQELSPVLSAALAQTPRGR
jgi:hypothetical protein